jgi:hypothetical protein
MLNYNQAHGRYFITIDSFIACAILSDAYTTDYELANLSMSSLSTVKRSINKLCEFGIVEKHISKTNQKTLLISSTHLEAFLNQYSNTKPIYESSVAHV